MTTVKIDGDPCHFREGLRIVPFRVCPGQRWPFLGRWTIMTPFRYCPWWHLHHRVSDWWRWRRGGGWTVKEVDHKSRTVTLE